MIQKPLEEEIYGEPVKFKSELHRDWFYNEAVAYLCCLKTSLAVAIINKFRFNDDWLNDKNRNYSSRATTRGQLLYAFQVLQDPRFKAIVEEKYFDSNFYILLKLKRDLKKSEQVRAKFEKTNEILLADLNETKEKLRRHEQKSVSYYEYNVLEQKFENLKKGTAKFPTYNECQECGGKIMAIPYAFKIIQLEQKIKELSK